MKKVRGSKERKRAQAKGIFFAYPKYNIILLPDQPWRVLKIYTLTKKKNNKRSQKKM
jgi:phosphatidate phosphatase APP1